MSTLTLEQCIASALEHNHRRPASQFAVAMAEARHQQAMSGYWPHATLKAGYERLDEAPNFIFPASQMYVPPQSVQVPAGTALINVPAGVLAPVAVQLPVSTPAQTVNTDGLLFPIPEQDIKLLDPEVIAASVDVTWLVYDGGMRRGFREQAQGYKDMMTQEARRTDMEIIDSVKRLYFGAVLARRLNAIGGETLERMEATLTLTETMYKEGSGTVKKTDYLDNKIMVESLRAMLAQLEKNEAMAQAALAFTMGRPWQHSVVPADEDLPWLPISPDLNNLVSAAYQFSPDWGKLEAGLRAAEGAERTARSGHQPKVAITGKLHRWWNDSNSGAATSANKSGYSFGIGFEVPLFDGFMTRAKVSEARARLNQVREQEFLLREGIGLRVRDIVLGMSAAEKSRQSTHEAMTAANENRDLNTRAYQAELVETENVIRSQLIEALMTAQHYKALYDHIALQSQLQLVVGTEIRGRLVRE
ncbi:TolC family protein [Synoicihabitans lomoniglobus]|uniref:TolC family protein n=1 Tax=Synoicihabitans lomoniglobus TaxID=2909285 RepID=A0AAE9ZVL3_9BACT|nr:TolC family protein [Opitutaceae bacterium LMO-M01]WED63263.1 TolC family protein [Opitutaceae bacterium LMO-M01]